MTSRLTRRRFIAISAVAGAGLLSAGPGFAGRPSGVHHWQGMALGAKASLQIAHPDPDEAQRLIALCTAEIERLERIFSLFRHDSAVRRLNAAGALSEPPIELVSLLARARAVSAASDGVFDVTVQPLWEAYHRHFARSDADPSGPALTDALASVDWRGVSVESHRIAFARSGMAVTLNGIAQGFITDRVADLLRSAGMEQVLVNLGEARALGHHPDGRAWRIGITDPADSRQLISQLDLQDAALATSGGYGTLFDREGRHSHLIDPRSGRTTPAERSITVVAAEATVADAWSTAFSLLSEEEIIRLAERQAGLRVYLASDRGFARLV